MSVSGENKGSLSGLAKRWLKNQIQVHGDPRRAYRERQESEAIEQEMKEKAQDDLGRTVFNAFAPSGLKEKISGLERHRVEQEAQREEQRRSEHAARPRADARIAVTGSVRGELITSIPALVELPHSDGDALTVDLSPIAPESIGGRRFESFMFAIPGYAGDGTYDLNRIAERTGTDDWDPFWFQLILDSIEEPFYWTTDYGRAVITVADAGKTLTAQIPMQNAGSESIDIAATISLA